MRFCAIPDHFGRNDVLELKDSKIASLTAVRSFADRRIEALTFFQRDENLMLAEDDRLRFVVSNFEELESKLIECLSFIPFIENNKAVISPKFIPIILEACSLIDSVFRTFECQQGKKHNLKSYTKLVEPHLYLEDASTIFLNPPLRFLRPFETWTRAAPPWWIACNKLKHDRLDNYRAATYENAILATSGLHQVLSRNIEFVPALISAGWFNSNGPDVVELMAARISSSGIPIQVIPVASKLFVSPLHDTFVSYDNGHPSVADCDFTDRVKALLAVHDWF